MNECFEVFKLRALLARLEGDDAKTVRMAIDKIEELQRELAIDEEMLCGVTISPTKLLGIVTLLREADSALCMNETVRGLSLVREAGAKAAGVEPATEPCAKVQKWTHG